MNLTAYINYDFVTLSLSSKLEEALRIFAQYTFTHIPVVEEGKLIGMLSEDDVKTFDPAKKVSEYQYTLTYFEVSDKTNWFDVLEAFAKNETSIMPVLEEEKYIGCFELQDILVIFNETPFLNEPGSTLIVEKGLKDYSFSQIAQIVESNNGKLLGAFISHAEDEKVQITMKIGNETLNTIIQTFRRYNYTIVLGNEEDMYLQELKDRSQYLQKYLNI